MKQIVIDFETYYDRDVSLKGMTTQEYIMHPEFEAMMMSYKIDDAPTEVIVSPTKHDLEQLGLDQALVIAHNAGFDISILSLRFGIKPKMIFDTLGAARALGMPAVSGCSLDALARVLTPVIAGMPTKGTAVQSMMGKRIKDLSPESLAAYVEYCKTDTDICYLLAQYFMPQMPVREAQFQDIIVRCASEPMIKVDSAIVRDALAEVMQRRDSLHTRLAHVLGATLEDTMQAIMSNQKFAAALTEVAKENHFPVEGLIPMKVSTKTGKMTHAFAKTDPGMAGLLEHPVEDIALLAATRMGLKTTTEHTRLERFLALSEYPALSIPYLISGAHTHRLSGAGKINLQNLPSGRVAGQSNAARRSLVAPDGSILVSGDSKQIETRVLAYCVGDQSSLDDFIAGRDPYITMAAMIFNTTYQDIEEQYNSPDPEIAAAGNLKRQIGKSARLGCGFQLGPTGFVNYCKVISRVDITDEESNNIVAQYRETNPDVVNMWAQCKQVLALMEQGMKGYFGGMDGKLFYYDGMTEVAGRRVPSIELPDGMKLYYSDLRWEPSKKFDGLSMVYTSYKGNSGTTHGIYGGKLVENLVQALAFSIMKWQGVALHRAGFKIVSNTHDEFTTIVPEAEAEARAEDMRTIMNTAPKWVEGLPLGSDVGFAHSYADC